MNAHQKTVPVLTPKGSIVGAKINTLSDGILSLLSSGYVFVLMDMGDISFISKQTIESLVSLSERFKSEGAFLGFTNPTEVVRNLISLRRSERELHYFYTTLEAEAYIIEEYGDVDFVYVSTPDELSSPENAGQESVVNSENECIEHSEQETGLSEEEDPEQVPVCTVGNCDVDSSPPPLDATSQREMDLDEIIDREILGEDYDSGYLSDVNESKAFSYTDAVSSVYSGNDESKDVDSDESALLTMSDDQLSDIVKSHSGTEVPFDYILEPDPLAVTTGKHKILDDIDEKISRHTSDFLNAQASEPVTNDDSSYDDQFEERIFPTDQINQVPFDSPLLHRSGSLQGTSGEEESFSVDCSGKRFSSRQ